VTTFALDSSAVLAWILQESGRWKLVDAVLNEADADPVLPGPVLTEVIVTAHRRGNTSSAQHIADTLTAMGMRVEPAQDTDLLRAAALIEMSEDHSGEHRLTAQRATLSLGDALILAVTERLGVKILTKDRYWTQFAASGHTPVGIIQI
jgi:PIN domain nuclease of toxin-antitoxin system